MANMKGGQLIKLSQLFDSISLRERTLIFYAVPLVILFIAVMFFIEPLYVSNQKNEAKLASAKSQLLLAQANIETLSQELGVDLNQALNQQIIKTENQIQQLTKTFENELNQLVQPKYVPILLEQMIDQAKGLTLLELSSVAPINIFEGDAGKDNIALYRHGIKMKFSGDYFTTRAFLASVEDLGWKLYWQQIDYQVSEYPSAHINIELFTLSTSEAFISVQ